MWMWIKRVLFSAAMLFALLGAIGAFDYQTFAEVKETAIFIVLNIAAILLAVGNSILYFRVGGGKSILLTLLIIAQIINSEILVRLGAFVHACELFGALFGFFIHINIFKEIWRFKLWCDRVKQRLL